MEAPRAQDSDHVPTDPGSGGTPEADGLEATWCRTPPPPQPSGLPAPPVPTPTQVANLGEVLGTYRLERVIGEGAMGVVFVGRHVKLGRQVAVKILKPQHSADGSLVQRFFQEARAVNAINHENIVEILDFVEEPAPPGAIPRYYCVLELLSGTNLRQLLVAEPLSVRRAVHIVRQLCAALGAAHRVGIIHRDVKPDNVFITARRGEPDFVKVLDFGVAKLSGTRLASNPDTFAGAVIGTPGYMAPEQASGLEVDGRSDLYAVGTVLYELLAGRRPFRATELGQWAVELIVTPPPPLPEKTPAGEPIPPELAALVMRCLEKDPAARFASMEELAEALKPYEGLPIALTVPSPTPVPRPPEAVKPASRSRPWWPWAAGLALLAVGTGVWTLRAAPGPEVAAPSASEAAAATPEAPGVAAQGPSVASATAPAAPGVGAQAAGVAPAAAPAAAVLHVRSMPSGARVFRSDTGEALGVTPLELTVSEPQPLRFELKGHQPAEATARPGGGDTVEVTLKPRKAPAPATKAPGQPKSAPRLTSPDGLLNPFRK
nr:serine/threonine-protein kinase Pkn1 [uncultured bacterium]